jgi:hypothetical protein
MIRDLGNLRWCVGEVLQLGKEGEEFLRKELKIAMAHVVHKIDVKDITKKGSHGRFSYDQCCQEWDKKKRKICQRLSKWVSQLPSTIEEHYSLILHAGFVKI